MSGIVVKAPAKINLFLKVLNKRPDNYHNIFSWFQAVDLNDFLRFETIASNRINLTINDGLTLPADHSNLVYLAADIMRKKFNLRGGVEITLKKNIPIAAGLAGGSSDAASTIYAINKLYDLNLSSETMARIGLEIGSDVPFFFSSGHAEVSGRGEILRNIFLPLDYYVVLVTPPIRISTAESYGALNLGLTTSGSDIKLSCPNNFGELVGEIDKIGNDFEKAHLLSYPELGRIKDELYRTGAALARMSGSGPTIYGLYENMPERGDLTRITRGDWHLHVVRPITLPAWE
jgi:4-diphosphocytidyl-2-C-methyl-D-erythritol kinase